MDSLLIPFVAAALAEWGDKTMLLALALAARFRRPAPILAGIALAALANAAVAAFAGYLVHPLVSQRALSLLVAVAFLYAGVAGLLGGRAASLGDGWKTGPFLTSAGCFFLLEFGDKTQFVTFALAARFDVPALVAGGATAGVIAANLPAVLSGGGFAQAAPLKPMRLVAAALFLAAGFVVGVDALRLT